MSVSQVDVQASVYERLPRGLRRPLNSVRLLPTYLRWRMAQDGRRKARRVLGALRGAFEGYRCVVIGNGPSLNEMDLSILEHEFTFGLNRIYLKFSEWGFSTSFLVSVNRFVISQFGRDMVAAPGLKVLNWRYSRHWLSGRPDVVGIVAEPFGEMDGEITNGYYLGGGTVTNVALELAHFLGFSEAIIIGVDHQYSESGPAGKPVVSRSADEDHFSPEYFGKGTVWQLPNFEVMERGYRRVRNLYELTSRRIVNATVGGNLEEFERVGSLAEELESSRFASKADWGAEHGTPPWLSRSTGRS